MTITLAANINATQCDITLSAGITADPGDLYRLGDELVEFGGYQQVIGGNFPELVTFQRGRAGTTAVSHVSGVELFGVSEALATSSDQDRPDPFSSSGGATPTLAEVLGEGNTTGLADIVVEADAGDRVWGSDTTPQSLIVWGADGSVSLNSGSNTIAIAADGTITLAPGGHTGTITILPDATVKIGEGDMLTLNSDFTVVLNAAGTLTIDAAGLLSYDNAVKLTGLPTADPLVAGALYSDGVPSAGVPKPLMVSGG